ncbi:hypothetical protein AGOR_G00113700 [Albula goreensis]|uniref:Uncharacterized protein n=1 Tax=Albula goreensis TaxID=1534307 RepID=A0A8T3DDK9_9TELE|nr:hypothetical protein AGOR_G00113700 [Albula goreensis]
MVPLEKQNKEYEAVRAELEEKNNSLKKYQQISEDLDRLKEENTELITLKKNLENQLKKSEESSLKQDHEITQLRTERQRLEKDLKKTQKNLETLELKNLKELKNGSTQTDFPAEPKIDKAKVKLLLEELWTCIEPQPSQTVNPLHLTGTRCESSEYHSDSSKTHLPAPRAKVATKATNSGSPRKRGRRSGELQKSDAYAEEEKQSAEPSGATQCGNRPNIDEILDCFKPMPPLLSPLCSTSSPETLFGGISDSSEDETNEMDLAKTQHNTNLKTSSEEDIDLRPKSIAIQHLDSSTNEPADVSVLASAHRDSLEVSAPCVPQMEVCKSAVNGETNTPLL